MNTKLLTGAGALLLLAAAVAPSVLGHDDLWHSSGGTQSRYPSYPGNDPDPNGVAGQYIGFAGPALAIEAYSNPEDTIATGSILCDTEVVVDDPTFPGNEEYIDGAPTAGLAPDYSLNDDGGIGGACHVDTYETDEFNTSGCYGGQSAYGRDHVAPYDIWIAATCDWKTSDGHGPSGEETLLLCIINEAVLQTDPLAPIECIEKYIEYIDCLTHPTCQMEGVVEMCGSDGTADAISFGYGSGNHQHVVFPTNTGITNGDPPVTAPCPDGAAAIFVFETVSTDAGEIVDPDGGGPLPGVYVPGTVNLYQPVIGYVWTGET